MLKQEVVKTLKSIDVETTEDYLETPPQPEFGDLAFPCFELAKKEKKAPQKIAEEITRKIKIPKVSIIEKVEPKACYVNFFFDWKKISENILKEILDKKESFGRLNLGKGKRVMVEFSQPNPVHSMHIGHARGTFLGDFLANLLEFVGYKVIRANYMNDTGLQVAKLVTAYLLWGKGKVPPEKPDLWLWKYYVKFHEEVGKRLELEEKAREILRKREIEHDKEIEKVWDKLVKWCVEGFQETYKKLGIDFDVYFYENEYRDFGKKLVEKALKQGVAFKSPESTIVVDLEKHGLPNFVLLRSDGTGLYQTSDLGLTVHKFEKYNLDKAIWVVASAQSLYFKQLFKTLELLGYSWVSNCYHFAFDLVQLPEGKMSSREGKAIILDEVIDKLTDLALEEVEKRNPKLSKKKKTEIAKKIAISALKYSITKIELDKTITFDWKQMLSFEGNTGPYLQYAHTRCSGILNKAGKWKPNFKTKELTEQEKKLIKNLIKFSEVVEQAAKNLKPHYICNYAYDLATVFNTFYQFCPVLKAKTEEQKNFRLSLVEATKIVLANALKLMGIEALEKM